MMRWHCTDAAVPSGSPFHSVRISSSLRTRSLDVASAGLAMPSSGLASRYSFSTAHRTIARTSSNTRVASTLRPRRRIASVTLRTSRRRSSASFTVADDRHDVLAQPPLDLGLAAQRSPFGIGEVCVDQAGDRHSGGRLPRQHQPRVIARLDVPARFQGLPTGRSEACGGIGADRRPRALAVARRGEDERPARCPCSVIRKAGPAPSCRNSRSGRLSGLAVEQKRSVSATVGMVVSPARLVAFRTPWVRQHALGCNRRATPCGRKETTYPRKSTVSAVQALQRVAGNCAGNHC